MAPLLPVNKTAFDQPFWETGVGTFPIAGPDASPTRTGKFVTPTSCFSSQIAERNGVCSSSALLNPMTSTIRSTTRSNRAS